MHIMRQQKIVHVAAASKLYTTGVNKIAVANIGL